MHELESLLAIAFRGKHEWRPARKHWSSTAGGHAINIRRHDRSLPGLSLAPDTRFYRYVAFGKIGAGSIWSRAD
jgi:hypothetical protein